MAISSVNRIVGTELNDTLRGDDLTNWLIGRGGSDRLAGLGGNDRLDGGDGNDLLSGGAGADTLIGGAGNDTYVVGAGDLVLEAAGGGLDTVITSTGRTLEAYVDNLTLVGAIDGRGNGLANVITGSDAANAIDGGLGADRIVGGRGADTLAGGGGPDSFVFASGFGHDIITDFQVGGEGHDVIELRGAFASRALTLDLVLATGSEFVLDPEAEDSQKSRTFVELALEPGNSLVIADTTLAELRAHPEAFAFFAA